LLRQRKYKGFCQAEIDEELDTIPNRDGDVQNAPFEVQDTSILTEQGQRLPYEIEYRPTLRSQTPAYEVEDTPVVQEREVEPAHVLRKL